jgi:hypothetical protein
VKEVYIVIPSLELTKKTTTKKKKKNGIMEYKKKIKKEQK